MSYTLPVNILTNKSLSHLDYDRQEEWQRSQISSGHRLIDLAQQKYHQHHSLYSKDMFMAKHEFVSADYVQNQFSFTLQAAMNEVIALRVNAAICRARKNALLYEVKKSGIFEFITEALFDHWWFKTNEAHFSRLQLRNQIKSLLTDKGQLNLYLPILSRKPFNPLKNRGPYPDLAEIHTLMRCAEAAQVINALSPYSCCIYILADGFKYNRACQTPDQVILEYQNGLNFWINHFNIGDIVKLVDYEAWVKNNISTQDINERSTLYENYCDYLTYKYGKFFNPVDINKGFTAITKNDDIGQQLQFTFWSILNSTFYTDLFNLTHYINIDFSEQYYGEDIQKLYLDYVSSIHSSLNQILFEHRYFSSLGYFSALDIKNLFYVMRTKAWQATIRYIAISLADRDLNLIKKITHNDIKLTIHSKKSEIHFITASKQNIAITAQHSTGGLILSKKGIKINLRYRLERESENEIPVLIEPMPDTSYYQNQFGPLYSLQKFNQPIFYIDQKLALLKRKNYVFITRKEQ